MTLSDITNRVTPPVPLFNPKWLTEDYEGNEADIAEIQFSAMYWVLREKAEAKLVEAKEPIYTEQQLIETEEGRLFQSRLMVEALSKATVQSSKKKNAFDRAFLILANRLKQTGFYRMVSEEYPTIEEWLADQIVDLPPGSGELSNVTFLLNEFLPMIDVIGNGFTAEDLMKLKEYKSKTYASIPHLRYVTNLAANTKVKYEEDIQKTEKQISKLENKLPIASGSKKRELQEQVDLLRLSKTELIKEAAEAEAENYYQVKKALERTLEVIQDTSIPAWGPNGVRDILKSGQPTIFEADKCYYVDNDKRKQVIFQIAVPVSYEHAVESMLRKLVEFSNTDGRQMIKALSYMIFPKTSKPKQQAKKR
jgi:hypothetical protein